MITYIRHDVTNEKGLVLGYHLVQSVKTVRSILSTARFIALVGSWPSLETMISQQEPVQSRALALDLGPSLLFDESLYDAVSQFLIEDASGEFYEGTLGSFSLEEETLTQARERKMRQMKSARDVSLAAGFVWDGSTFDSDQVAQTRLLGAYVDSREEGFEPVAWRLADNSWRVLSGTDVANVWAALKTHLRGHFIQFATREAQVAAAATVEEVELVVW